MALGGGEYERGVARRITVVDVIRPHREHGIDECKVAIAGGRVEFAWHAWRATFGGT